MEDLKSFLWRVWNTAKYPILTIALGVSAKIINDVVAAQTVLVLTSPMYWDGVAVTVLSLLGGVLGVSGMAGVDKIIRKSR